MKKKILSALILLFSFTAVVSGESADSANHSRIADSSEMTTVDEVIEEGVIAVYGDQIKDGVYSIDVNTSSSMFFHRELASLLWRGWRNDCCSATMGTALCIFIRVLLRRLRRLLKRI